MKSYLKAASMVTAMTVAAGAMAGCGQTRTDQATTDTQIARDTYTESSYYEGAAEETMAAEESYDYAETETADYSMAKSEAMYEDNGIAEGGCVLDGSEVEAYDIPENTESYEKVEENGFDLVATKPLSTFAADVDTASYSNVRRMIENGYSLSEINPDAVRAEEFINYFQYDLHAPEGKDKFGLTTEISKCPWNEDHDLMFVGMKTEDIDFRESPDANLVFLIDVSGSMDEPNKLPLLQKAFKEMVDELPGRGTISMVTYSGREEVVLSGESMKNKEAIKDAIDELSAYGSTNGESGIKKAYEIAKQYYIDGGINRVIMATDGDLNVGVSSPEELEQLIKTKKDDGIFLSVLGFGMGNYKDDNLEKLADCGNGNYSYIDSLLEAKKVMVDEMGGTLVTVAKDVKLQVEFNPARVNAYRLIGYENRIMADADFADDTKDGGEIGAGHSVVALYEIIPADSESAISLKYAEKTEVDYSSEYATLSIRYKEPEGNKSDLVSVAIGNDSYSDEPSENLRFAGLVSEFAMILSNSDNKGTATLEGIMEDYKKVENTDEYKDEFYQMVRMVAKRG